MKAGAASTGSAFAELGLCAAPFQESSGGLGGGSLATMIVMQEFGRSLVVEPYFETVVLAGGLIEDVASPEQRQAFLPKIMEGEAIWALAWAEGRSRYDFNNVTTTARRQGDKFVLSGTKAAVVGAPWADKLIVSARTSGEPRDRIWREPFRGRSPFGQSSLAELQDHRWPARRRTDADGRGSAGRPVAWYRRRRRSGARGVP